MEQFPTPGCHLSWICRVRDCGISVDPKHGAQRACARCKGAHTKPGNRKPSLRPAEGGSRRQTDEGKAVPERPSSGPSGHLRLTLPAAPPRGRRDGGGCLDPSTRFGSKVAAQPTDERKTLPTRPSSGPPGHLRLTLPAAPPRGRRDGDGGCTSAFYFPVQYYSIFPNLFARQCSLTRPGWPGECGGRKTQKVPVATDTIVPLIHPWHGPAIAPSLARGEAPAHAPCRCGG